MFDFDVKFCLFMLVEIINFFYGFWFMVVDNVISLSKVNDFFKSFLVFYILVSKGMMFIDVCFFLEKVLGIRY